MTVMQQRFDLQMRHRRQSKRGSGGRRRRGKKQGFRCKRNHVREINKIMRDLIVGVEEEKLVGVFSGVSDDEVDEARGDE
mmetsp:Transcript_15375/g.32513  ORF Transcript_15375/g.32513 Transcript_15375/m.32513 type:complete len:80 (+) Transcript_15375:2170-2409(+)